MSTTGIAFDVTPSITGSTGIARYVRSVTDALEGAGTEVRRFAIGRGTTSPPSGTAWCRVPLRIVAASWRLGGPPSVERLVGSVRTVHASGSVLPRANAPIVAVVHDLAPLDHPSLHPPRQVDQLRRYVADLHRAAAVVAVSESTATRVRELVPGQVVHVTPNGTTPLPAPDPPPDPPARYVLAVGAPVPRKGYSQLLHALAEPQLQGLSLVVVGPPGSEDENLSTLAHRLGLVDRFVRPGAVDDARLAGWYAGASVLAAPSTEEGFGLPIVEAQRQGTLVVASDIAAHREVGGDAATLVPTGDLDALVAAIAGCVHRDHRTEARIDAGRRNAARFTWDACAEATLAVHRLICPE